MDPKAGRADELHRQGFVIRGRVYRIFGVYPGGPVVFVDPKNLLAFHESQFRLYKKSSASGVATLHRIRANPRMAI